MILQNLRNLVGLGKLKEETPNEREFDGLIRSAAARLRDAHNAALAPESRFDVAYNAAHSLALAALRKRGFRSDNRYLVFHCLPYTVAPGLKSGGCSTNVISVEIWRSTRVWSTSSRLCSTP